MSLTPRSYSRYAQEALRLLGKEIELARKSKRITAEVLAERCGISRPTLRKVERGEPTVEIGVAFEAAAIVGIKLFESESSKGLHTQFLHASEKVALLPQSVRLKGRREPSDAF